MCRFRTRHASRGPGRYSLRPDLRGLTLLKGSTACGCSWGRNNPNALLSHPSFPVCVSVSLSVCSSPPPSVLFLLTVTFWWRVAWILWVPSCGPSPAAEFVQLGLLGSLRNLPVSQRVQLAHLGQLRLHHGRLGLHREGDRPGSATKAPRPRPLPPPRPLLMPQAQEPGHSESTPRAWGRDETEGFLLRVSGSQTRTVRPSRGSRAMGNAEV